MQTFVPRAARDGRILLASGVIAVGLGAGPAVETARAPIVDRVEGTTLTIEMQPIPGGAVEINGETHVVKPFYLARHETTWDLYDAFVLRLDGSTEDGDAAADLVTRPSRPYILMDRGYGHAGYPVVSVSYKGARQYCEWLSKKTGRTYRLPTEAEWLHVCRNGGVEASNLDEHAWHRKNARRKTHPVGKKKPDAFGVHDMTGNALEWVTGVDGEPVTMGGSFRDPPDQLACGGRTEPTPMWNDSDPQIPKSVWWLADAGWVGFRVVCETPAASE